MMQDMFHVHHISFANGVPPAINGPVPRPPRSKNNAPKKATPPKKSTPPKNVTQNGGGQRKAKPMETFVDQRFSFSLGKTIEPEVLRDIKNFCRECAKAFQDADDFAEHCLTEEHKFRAFYMKTRQAYFFV